MKTWLVICLMGVSAYSALSQTDSSAREIPQGPLLAVRSADSSAWTATFAYTGEPETATDEKYQKALKEMADQDPVLAKILAKRPNFAARKPRITEIHVVKTGPIKKEITVYASGVQAERWVMDRMVVKKDPFQGRVQLRVVEGEGLEADFPEFAWVSERNYKGSEKISGREFLVFEDNILPVRVEDPRSAEELGIVEGEPVPVKALIDAKTRLPAALEYMGIRRAYAFGNPPAGILSLPPDLMAEVQKSEKLFKAQNAPLSAP